MRKKLLRNTCAWGLVCFLASLSLADPAHAGATITVFNNDGAGEGFNDPSAPDPASTTGGNPGATLGDQRLIAFQFAANIWGTVIDSPVEIKVDATFDELFCDATSAVLGSAGPNTAHRDFTGAPVAATFYVQALANARNGSDLDALNDIASQFNSTLGTTCPIPLGWYYGLDGSPPAGTIDFRTVVLHEIAHGLGFLSLVDLASGAKLGGFDDAYMRLLEDHTTGLLYPAMTDAERVTASTNTGNLHWTGTEAITCGDPVLTAGRDPLTGHIEMYAPNPAEGGSSVSHWSTTLSPDQLMEPFITGPNLPQIDVCLLVDLGWTLMPPPTTTTTVPTTTTTTVPTTTTTTVSTTTTTTLPQQVTCNGLPATIVGNNGNNTITGTPGNDVIHGLGGNDIIRGKAGNDTVCGGNGRDTLFGNGDRDNLFGQAGNDSMNGGPGSDLCNGGSGTDTAANCETTPNVP